MVRDLYLEARHAIDGSSRSTDFSGKVRERREVVTERGTHRSESVPSELHSVTGVTSESDDESVKYLSRFGLVNRVGHFHPPPVSVDRCHVLHQTLVIERRVDRAQPVIF